MDQFAPIHWQHADEHTPNNEITKFNVYQVEITVCQNCQNNNNDAIESAMTAKIMKKTRVASGLRRVRWEKMLNHFQTVIYRLICDAAFPDGR